MVMTVYWGAQGDLKCESFPRRMSISHGMLEKEDRMGIDCGNREWDGRRRAKGEKLRQLY